MTKLFLLNFIIEDSSGKKTTWKKVEGNFMLNASVP